MLGFTLTEAVGLLVFMMVFLTYSFINYPLYLLLIVIKVVLFLFIDLFQYYLNFSLYNILDKFIIKKNFKFNGVFGFIFFYYILFVLFIRSFFKKERPVIIILIGILFFFNLFVITFFTTISFINFTLLLGVYMFVLDVYGNVFSTLLLTNPDSGFTLAFYLFLDHQKTSKNVIKRFVGFRAAASIFFGPSGLTPTGKASIFVAVSTSCALIVNSELDRRHATILQEDAQSHASRENALNRTHESRENALNRAEESRKNTSSWFFKK